MRLWGLAVTTVLIASTVASAEPSATQGVGGSAGGAAGAAAPAKPSDAPLPSCLDQSIAGELAEQLKPRGVQKKTFLKRHKLNIVAHGGLYAGDLTSSSWIAGGAVGMFLTEDFGVQAQFDFTPMMLDLDSPLNKFFGDNRFQPGMAKLALGNLMWSPIHAKLKLGGGIVHSDILLFAGGGRLIHDSVQGLALDAGGAIDVFVSRFATIRLDIRDLEAVEEIAGEVRRTNNVIATAGLSFWIPVGW